jgi:hypothetical protein
MCVTLSLVEQTQIISDRKPVYKTRSQLALTEDTLRKQWPEELVGQDAVVRGPIRVGTLHRLSAGQGGYLGAGHYP